MLDQVLAYIRENRPQALAGLKEFLRIPSVSTLSSHRHHVAAAADFVGLMLRNSGMDDVTVETGNGDEHPLVRAEWCHAPGKPTLLLYAHYDVQPVEPLDEWHSPPFKPTVSADGELIFARGSADDKGQLWILCCVLEAFLKSTEKLPINIKVLFEGEEETSGAHIERFVRENKEWLQGIDAALVLDDGMFRKGLPTIVTGLRGIVCARITCHGSHQELHSGEDGGAAPNAAHALAKIISAFHTPTGRVRIPGFYDQVQAPTALELASWRSLPFDEAEYQQELAAPALIGDRRYSVLQRRWGLPTLDVNGFSGGYTGEGWKGVIPHKAWAEVSMRIVPGMDPERTARIFEEFVRANAPKQVTTDVKVSWKSPAMVVDTANLYVRQAAEAFRITYGKDTAYVREGGSIPIAQTFQSVLGVPVLITGFTQPGQNIHAPNENLNLPYFYSGIEAIAVYFDLLGR